VIEDAFDEDEIVDETPKHADESAIIDNYGEDEEIGNNEADDGFDMNYS